MPETLTAGRELDALVAEKVMGWRRRFGAFHGTEWSDVAVILLPFEPGKYPIEPKYTNAPATVVSPVLPYYSAVIGDAWLVQEKLQETDWALSLEYEAPRGPGGNGWCAMFGHHQYDAVVYYATTAPLAICRAALLAVENTDAR